MDHVTPPAIQAKIDSYEAVIARHEEIIEELKLKIKKLVMDSSPIQPGMIINWLSKRGNSDRNYRGRVVAIQPCWKGFEFRCHLLTADGREVGYANVGTDQYPVIEDKPKRKRS
jgi:hypothetical protein